MDTVGQQGDCAFAVKTNYVFIAPAIASPFSFKCQLKTHHFKQASNDLYNFISHRNALFYLIYMFLVFTVQSLQLGPVLQQFVTSAVQKLQYEVL